MKILLGTIAVLILVASVFVFWTPENNVGDNINTEPVLSTDNAEDASVTEERSFVANGSYLAVVEESTVSWAGKKPLIEGYVNNGSLKPRSASINVVDGVITGELTIDMNTLSVSKTPAKPGKESMLEEHLKGDKWFNVSTFPEAKFVLTEVTPQADVATTFMYNVKGNLTMKGETHELTFSALIYSDAYGLTHASAEFEFDRTLWGITAGSGSFFDNLADNVVDDMVAMSFELVTVKK